MQEQESDHIGFISELSVSSSSTISPYLTRAKCCSAREVWEREAARPRCWTLVKSVQGPLQLPGEACPRHMLPGAAITPSCSKGEKTRAQHTHTHWIYTLTSTHMTKHQKTKKRHDFTSNLKLWYMWTVSLRLSLCPLSRPQIPEPALCVSVCVYLCVRLCRRQHSGWRDGGGFKNSPRQRVPVRPPTRSTQLGLAPQKGG